MVRFVSVKSQSTPWIAISIWTCPIVQSEPRLKLKKKIKMPWNAIIGSFNSIDKIIVIKNIDWVAKKATSSTLLELF